MVVGQEQLSPVGHRFVTVRARADRLEHGGPVASVRTISDMKRGSVAETFHIAGGGSSDPVNRKDLCRGAKQRLKVRLQDTWIHNGQRRGIAVAVRHCGYRATSRAGPIFTSIIAISTRRFLARASGVDPSTRGLPCP